MKYILIKSVVGKNCEHINREIGEEIWNRRTCVVPCVNPADINEAFIRCEKYNAYRKDCGCQAEVKEI